MDEENESGRELGLLVPHLKFISKTPLLATESAGEFKKFSAALGKGLNTRNIVEDMLAIDVRALATETARLRRTKTNLIKMAFPDAIKRLLFDTLKLVDEDQAVRLAQNWSTDEAAQQQVKEILMMAQLDEYAIEAEAIRSLAPILSALDEMLASLEYRSLRALRTLSDWRLAFLAADYSKPPQCGKKRRPALGQRKKSDASQRAAPWIDPELVRERRDRTGN